MNGDNLDGINVGNHNLRRLPERVANQPNNPHVQAYQPVIPGLAAAVPVPQHPQDHVHEEQPPPDNIEQQINPNQILIPEQQPLPAMAQPNTRDAKYPPTFHGKSHENVKHFVRKFRAYCGIKGIQGDLAQVKIHLGQFIADGPCTRWVEQNDDNEDLNTVNLYLEAFKDHFYRPEPNFNLKLKIKARTFQPTDTLESYADDIQDLCEEVDMDEAGVIDTFIMGLPVAIRGSIANHNPTSFSQALSHAFTLRDLLPGEGNKVTPAPVAAVANPCLTHLPL